MKNSLIFLIGSLILINIAQGQSFRQYVVKVQFATHSGTEKGILYDLTDSTILLARPEGFKPKLKAVIKQHGGTLPPADALRQELPLRTYRYADISRVTLHRRGSAAKGFLIGAGIGATASAVGLILFPDGFNVNFSGSPRPDVTPARKALGALGTTVLAGAPGLVIGAAMTKRIDTKEHPISAEVRQRFRDYTIVEQMNQAKLYSRYR